MIVNRTITKITDSSQFLSVIESRSRIYDLCHVVLWGQQLARALRHMHNIGIIHNDIKPDNILLSENGLTLKLCDLGISRTLSGDNLEATFNVVYAAPELHRDRHNHSVQSDTYSYGLTMYHVITCKLPFEGVPVSQIGARKNNVSCTEWEFADNTPKELIALIYACCKRDPPSKRASMSLIITYLGTVAKKFPLSPIRNLQGWDRAWTYN